MENINDLLDENRKNWFKLLTIVGNNRLKEKKIINYLKKEDWQVYDVEEKIFELSDKIPPEKIKLRIGSEIKRWVKSLGDKSIFINTSILYSEELGKVGPYGQFKYHMRGNKEGIIFIQARLRGNLAIYSTPDRLDYNETELEEVVYADLDKIAIPGDNNDSN
ncbi:MAG: BREX-3 system P-loop-containing protein BrxF [Methanobacterium sp.]|nr:BREX-3 system P-loop-containing protein BrxF [Methanobacterium sp.]